jgi:CRISPR-associated protein Csx10
MDLQLTFEIIFSADYHVSAGFGLGARADSALLRDADGVPVIRGTSVVGLLRDGLWRLLQLPPLKRQRYQRCEASGASNGSRYCGQHDDQSPLCPVCRLFGSPAFPKRWQFSSARPAGIEQMRSQAKGWGAGGAGGQIVRRVRVAPDTRRAAPRKLFSQEDGDQRLRFRFVATCRSQDDTAWDDAALLVAAARYIRGLGRSRRRGHGACVINLLSIEPQHASNVSQGENAQDALLERFRERWLDAPALPPHLAHATPYASKTPSAAGNESVRLRLIMRTDEPVVIAQRAEAGNQFESLDVISGQTVLGALANLAAHRYGMYGAQWRGHTAYNDFVEVFFNGGVRFPVLVPADSTSTLLRPSIPAPRNLLVCKLHPYFEKSRKQHLFVIARNQDQGTKCAECASALTGVDGFVYWSSDKRWERLESDHRSELHIQIDPGRGRVAPGNLFGYVALEARQYFVGDLVCRNERAWEMLQALTGVAEDQPFELRIGKANRRGYGNVTMRLERMRSDALATGVGVSFAQRVTNTSEPLALTLLTDAILPDRWGRAWLGFEAAPIGEQHVAAAAWLREALGTPVDILAAFSQTRVVDGFNTQHGLPRQRDIALAAGSTVIFQPQSTPDDWLNHLETLERTGIGTRCNEGFGHIVFNHPIQVRQPMEGSIQLRGLDLPGQINHELNQEAKFRKKWSDALNKNHDQIHKECSNPRFAMLARWLYAHADDLQLLIDQLADSSADIWGQPSQALLSRIDHYGDRSKENFFVEDGADGRRTVLTLLERLKNQHPPSMWAIGVNMLAERVAETTQEDGQ